MKNRTWCIAAIFVFVSPYSCHKPTPQEEYDHARQCYVVLDLVLKRIPAAGLKQAGLDRGTIQTAADDFLGGTWADGKALGMTIDAISTDIERARLSYSTAGTADERLNALRDDANECLGDYYGRPND